MRVKAITFGFFLLISTVGAKPIRDDKVLLTAKSAVGDICMIKDVQEMVLDTTTSAKGAKDEKSKSDYRTTQEYKREVVAIDPAGFPSQVKEFFTQNWIIDPSNKVDMPHHRELEGKSVRVSRTKDGADVSISSGILTPDDQEALRFDVAAPELPLFPDHPIAEGESWKPDPALLGGANMMKVNSINATLVDIVDFAGRKCAHFRGSIDLQEPTGSQSKSHTVMTCEGNYALDIQRMVSLKSSGTVELLSVEKLDAGPTTFSSKGTVSFSSMWVWKQIAGKPLTKPN